MTQKLVSLVLIFKKNRTTDPNFQKNNGQIRSKYANLVIKKNKPINNGQIRSKYANLVIKKNKPMNNGQIRSKYANLVIKKNITATDQSEHSNSYTDSPDSYTDSF